MQEADFHKKTTNGKKIIDRLLQFSPNPRNKALFAMCEENQMKDEITSFYAFTFRGFYFATVFSCFLHADRVLCYRQTHLQHLPQHRREDSDSFCVGKRRDMAPLWVEREKPASHHFERIGLVSCACCWLLIKSKMTSFSSEKRQNPDYDAYIPEDLGAKKAYYGVKFKGTPENFEKDRIFFSDVGQNSHLKFQRRHDITTRIVSRCCGFPGATSRQVVSLFYLFFLLSLL